MIHRFSLFILAFVIVLDVYSYQAVRTLTRDSSERTKNIAAIIFWSITAITFISIIISALNPSLITHKQWRFFTMGFLTLFYIPKLFVVLFLLIDDVIRLFRWIFSFIIPPKTESAGHKISRSKFLSMTGSLIGGFLFLNLFYGIVRGAYNYQLKRHVLKFPNLPKSFDGLKIIQISDIHTGSFVSTAPLAHAVDLINKEEPDLVLFTGDLVNSLATEANDYIDVLKNIKAKMGVYSIKGNHDYGDYYDWSNAAEKDADQQLLDEHHKNLGWQLLKDETIAIEKDGDSIALIGMENWGKRFQQYGDIHKARIGSEKFPFKILMSHDPSCFDEQIKTAHKDIDLTLSGHTHGMQFGVKLGKWEWSPVSLAYRYWGGVYKEGNQIINVNRGLGFIGYPGRVGILPEITVMTLIS